LEFEKGMKRKNKTNTFLGAVLMLLACPLAGAQDTSVRASVPTPNVVVNNPFVVMVTATGTIVGDPISPEADGIEFNPTPVYTNSSIKMEIVRGLSRTSRTFEWGFQAWATRPGALKIPPFQVSIDGQLQPSNEVKITASKADTPIPPPPTSGRTQGQGAGGEGNPTVEDALFLECVADKRRVYQGEPLTLTLRIFELDVPGLRTSYTGGSSIPLPATEGFYTGNISKRERMEDRNQWRYRVSEFKQDLYPTGAGEFTIGSWAWEGNIFWFSPRGQQRQYRVLRTDPIVVTVLPLPSRPPEFSGAVGRFRISTRLLKAEVVQGAPTQLQVLVKGYGNADAIGEPKLPEIPWAHISGPEIETRRPDEHKWSEVEKEFKYNITPLEMGELTIPPVTFCYFAPNLGGFKTETTNPLQVHVQPSSEENRLVVAGSGLSRQPSIEILGEDILPIVMVPGRLRPPRSATPLYAAMMTGPPLLYLGLFAFLRRKKRFEQDTAYARSYHARSKCMKRLKQIEKATEPSEELYHAVMGYLADKFNVNEGGLTPQEARRLLESAGVEAGLLETILRILRACERARYAGLPLQREELGALSRGALTAIERLESLLNGRGGK
jgi:hypothetical protein